MTPKFRWTKQSTKAALLVALDELNDEQIAAKVGVSRRTLAGWKTHDDFRARVDEHVTSFRTAAAGAGIATVQGRVAALEDRWHRLRQVIEERGRADGMDKVPGGTTGLLAHDIKSVGGGIAAERVDVYSVDTALLKELREHEKQAAMELGQWTEKADLTSGGKPIKLLPIKLDGDREL